MSRDILIYLEKRDRGEEEGKEVKASVLWLLLLAWGFIVISIFQGGKSWKGLSEIGTST